MVHMVIIGPGTKEEINECQLWYHQHSHGHFTSSVCEAVLNPAGCLRFDLGL